MLNEPPWGILVGLELLIEFFLDLDVLRWKKNVNPLLDSALKWYLSFWKPFQPVRFAMMGNDLISE